MGSTTFKGAGRSRILEALSYAIWAYFEAFWYKMGLKNIVDQNWEGGGGGGESVAPPPRSAIDRS